METRTKKIIWLGMIAFIALVVLVVLAFLIMRKKNGVQKVSPQNPVQVQDEAQAGNSTEDIPVQIAPPMDPKIQAQAQQLDNLRNAAEAQKNQQPSATGGQTIAPAQSLNQVQNQAKQLDELRKNAQ